MTDFSKRRKRLRGLLRADGAEAMLVTNFTNVQYLTGFTGGDSFLLVTLDDDLLLSDPRYEQQIEEECPNLKTSIREPGELTWDFTCRELAKQNLAGLVIESSAMSVAAYDELSGRAVVGELWKGTVQVETLRAIKDRHEIASIRTAVMIAERVFTSVRAQLTGAQTELDIAHELEYQIRKLGGSACSFRPIVAVGPRAALPHATPGNSPIGSSPFVLIDWGAVLDGYRSDLTRMLVTGKIPAKFVKVYETVLAAQTAAISGLRAGVMVSEIDAIARDVISAAGMGKRFNHGLGHGIGLDIHESPRLGKNADCPLAAGMVVTVEPGVYYPGWGGVRIEDDVLITNDGYEVLSTLPKDLANCRVDLVC